MVDEILDPWNSRPLDVHRWSEHPEVKVLVDVRLILHPTEAEKLQDSLE